MHGIAFHRGPTTGPDSRWTENNVKQSDRVLQPSWLSILFRAPLHRLLSEPLRPLYILAAPGFTCVMVPTEQGNRWACAVQVDAEQAAGWDTGRCRSFIVENAGDQELPVDVLDRKLFHMSAQVAEAFGKDRLLLAGHAAHPVPPTTGMGLNIAVADGAVLGQMLARWLNTDSEPADLLAAYERERRPIAEAVLAASFPAVLGESNESILARLDN